MKKVKLQEWKCVSHQTCRGEYNPRSEPSRKRRIYPLIYHQPIWRLRSIWKSTKRKSGCSHSSTNPTSPIRWTWPNCAQGQTLTYTSLDRNQGWQQRQQQRILPPEKDISNNGYKKEDIYSCGDDDEGIYSDYSGDVEGDRNYEPVTPSPYEQLALSFPCMKLRKRRQVNYRHLHKYEDDHENIMNHVM